MSQTTAIQRVEPQQHALAQRSYDPEVMARVVLTGDLSRLTPDDKVKYYAMVCESAGLDPSLRPFAYLKLNGREILYADKGCAEQLRAKNGISIRIVQTATVSDVYVVTVEGETREGRKDSAMGAVNIKGNSGESLANALMKAETKAKRRLTLSMCGLGMLDESEVETIPGAEHTAFQGAGPTATVTQGVQQQAPQTQQAAKPAQTAATTTTTTAATTATTEPILTADESAYWKEEFDAAVAERNLNLPAAEMVLAEALIKLRATPETITKSVIEKCVLAVKAGKWDAAVAKRMAPPANDAGAGQRPTGAPTQSELDAIAAIENWEQFQDVAGMLAKARGVNDIAFANGIECAVTKIQRNGRENTISRPKLREWATAIAQGAFDWDGKK